MGFFRFIWDLARSVPSWEVGLRPGSGAALLWGRLIGVFVIIAAVAWLFGVSPADLGLWFDEHENWMYAIVDWGMRGFCALVLLVCAVIVFAIGVEWFGAKAKQHEDSPRDVKGGCCGLIAVFVVGYFAWIGMTMPYPF